MIQTAGKTRQAKRGINDPSKMIEIIHPNDENYSSRMIKNIHRSKTITIIFSSECDRFQYILAAPTSIATKYGDPSLTYINQGQVGLQQVGQLPKLFSVFQSYEIKIKKLGDLSCHYRKKWLRSTIRICFHERRLQYIESEQIAEWARWVLHHLPPHFIAKRTVPVLYFSSTFYICSRTELIQTSGSWKWTHR